MSTNEPQKARAERLKARLASGATRAVQRSPALTRLASRRGHAARVEFYRQFAGPGDLVFDVGAHMGNRVAAFRALGARVVAVEPQAACLRQLHKRFDGEDVTIVPEALGSAPGEAELFVSNASTLTTLSSDWADITTESGRFADFSWERSGTVAVTTLDDLIDEHGVPVFCKIDVEGFESEVLAGLTRPVGVVSIEWVPEGTENTEACLQRLEELGATRFNLSLTESYALASPTWKSLRELREQLDAYRDTLTFGDIYGAWE